MHQEYSKGDLAPRYLTPNEIANPTQVLYDFYSHDHLPGIREKLKQWTRLTLTGNYNQEMSRKERVNLVYFIEHVERIIEATHIIHDRKHGSMLRRIVEQKKLKDSVSDDSVFYEKPGLKKITKSILHTTNAIKIFLLEPSAETIQHFLIIIPDHNHTPFETILSQLESYLPDDFVAHFQLIKCKHLHTLLSAGNLFYHVKLRSAQILFDDGSLILPNFSVADTSILTSAMKSSFLAGIAKSKAFLQCADSQRTDTGTRLFMIHQAIELCYRSIVFHIEGIELSTHQLAKLIEAGNKILPELATLFNLADEKTQDILSIIQASYIKGRYDCNYTPEGSFIEALRPQVKLLHEKSIAGFEKLIEHYQKNE